MRELFGSIARVLACSCILAATLGVAAAPAGAVVLGSAGYIPVSGGGWGTTEPATLSNGGAPSGVLTGISWKNWGAPTATGSGMASIYKPSYNYYPRVRVPLRVTEIGTCPGETEAAYLRLEVRLPQWPGSPLGPWFKWSGSLNLCGYSVKDPAYESGNFPGYCGYTGEFKEAGKVFNIVANHVGCKRARKIATTPIRGSDRHRSDCYRKGCSQRVSGFKCSYHSVQAIDYTDSDGGQVSNPLQRVACTKGRSSVTWFSVLFYD
jgi:hypothetical protein